MYTLRIIRRCKGGRHVEVINEHFGWMSDAIRRAEVLRQDAGVTVDLYRN